jgi:hypothetical protein
MATEKKTKTMLYRSIYVTLAFNYLCLLIHVSFYILLTIAIGSFNPIPTSVAEYSPNFPSRSIKVINYQM